MSAHERRKTQLGMPYGTACNKLRKSILFKCLEELGYNNCFVCKEIISIPEDLSIEHILPWEGREDGVEKFWDLNNIAFSHLRCNIKHSINNGSETRKIKCPEGTLWCGGHKECIPIENFNKDKSRWTGHQKRCRMCHKAMKTVNLPS